MTEPVNEFQRAALEAYAFGDFNHIETHSADAEYGDSLLSFVLIELSSKERCDGWDTAIDRIETAVEDLKVVLDALQDAAERGGAGDKDWHHDA